MAGGQDIESFVKCNSDLESIIHLIKFLQTITAIILFVVTIWFAIKYFKKDKYSSLYNSMWRNQVFQCHSLITYNLYIALMSIGF